MQTQAEGQFAHQAGVSLPPHTPFSLVTVAILSLIGWRVYARVRRNIGRQHFVPARSWASVTLFALIIVTLAFGLRLQPPIAGMSLAGGLALGVGLGLVGLRLTRFEATTEGLYYVPSALLGIALSTLVVARLVYRVLTSGFPGNDPGTAPATHLTPLTLLLIGTLAGYYLTYAAGVLRWSMRHRRMQQSITPT
jgi:hypothetical protein